ncbi:ANTAR domain-containing protein [Streptomyces scabiei]|uniref:ANTAR domain-containing protein n=1 Tax=Streptomyces scabiei TaxID=1930 RepID=UPI0038F74793
MDVPHSSRPEPADVRHPREPDDPATRISDLQRDNDQLQTALTSHAVIDQAIGVIIALGGLRPQQGFDVLRDVSQHTNIKLREIAGLVVDWALTRQLSDEVHRALDAALTRAQSAAAHAGPRDATTDGGERTADDGQPAP